MNDSSLVKRGQLRAQERYKTVSLLHLYTCSYATVTSREASSVYMWFFHMQKIVVFAELEQFCKEKLLGSFSIW